MKDRLILSLLGILLLAGCGRDEPAEVAGVATPPGSGQLAAKALQVSVVCPAQPSELSDAIKSGSDSAIQTLQNNEGVKINAKWCPYKSQSELQDALQTAVLNHDQAVLLRPDPKFNIDIQLKQLADAGVKVITLGTDVKKGQRAVFCGIPDEKLGNRLGYSIAGQKTVATSLGVVYDDQDAALLRGLVEVSKRYSKISLKLMPSKSVDSKGILAAIHAHPELKSWVVFKGNLLADTQDLATLDAKRVEIYTLGCWPRQLPLLESGLLKPLSLPSYELGYLAMCRAVDLSALRRKTDDTYMISTPLVDSKSVRTYALTLRRWGFTNVASRYLDTVRSGGSDNVR